LNPVRRERKSETFRQIHSVKTFNQLSTVSKSRKLKLLKQVLSLVTSNFVLKLKVEKSFL
jgi:hypothetical protein